MDRSGSRGVGRRTFGHVKRKALNSSSEPGSHLDTKTCTPLRMWAAGQAQEHQDSGRTGWPEWGWCWEWGGVEGDLADGVQTATRRD